MKHIQKPSGEVITNQNEILTLIKDFYQNLFMNKDNTLWEANFNDMFFYNNVTHLSENQSQELEGPLKIIELSNALKSMKNGKIPGIDGFPAEFLKVFWEKFKFFILRVMNHVYEYGEMSLSFHQCIITCLPKQCFLGLFFLEVN